MTHRPCILKVCCPEHPDSILIEDYHAGDLICPDCGLVVGDRVIDVGSEWRTFNNEKDSKDNSRVGGPENPLLDGSDLSTGISNGTGAASFTEDGRPMYNNKRVISTGDRALVTAFREISQMADRINLPKIISEKANLLFKKVHETKILKGRSNDAIASACLYIACRQEKVPRTFKEICAISKISKKEIGRVYKIIQQNFETNIEQISSDDFMSRFCTHLGLSNLIQRAATHIAKMANDFNLVAGRSPVSIAAAAIYMASQASDDRKTAKEIGDISGVSESTVKTSYKLMLPRVGELFPDGFKFSMPLECLPTS